MLARIGTVLVILSSAHVCSWGQEAAMSLVLNELMASNGGCCPDPQGEFDDWIEIYNPDRRTVDLAGFYLTDDLDEPTKWQFPLAMPHLTRISSREYLIVWADGDTAEGLHAGFKLNAEGEELGLYAPNGLTLIDAIPFPAQAGDSSYGRAGDRPEEWRFMIAPTPGLPNDEGYLGTVSTPRVSPERGFYGRRFTAKITCDTVGASIYYTTDGTDPLVSGDSVAAGASLYMGPFSIKSTTCLRVAAILPGYRPAARVTHTYLLHVSETIKSLPVISLVGDERETFYEPQGVMAIVGGQYVNGVWTPTGANSYNNALVRGYERPVSFEWLDPNGGTNLQADCGLRVHGSGWMRPRYRRSNGIWTGNNKFSLRLYFRDEYGPDWLEYPLFPGGSDRYKSIVLRGGHNDRTNPFIKDELIRRLHQDMGHAASVGTFASLFINGQYKGYFNPCEHINEAFCRDRFDSRGQFDIVEMFGGTREGDRIRWNALMSMAGRDLSNPDNYDAVVERLDLVEFIDTLILRLWSGDWDWPHNNWSAAAERSDSGQWRFFVWDAEGSMFGDRLNQVVFDQLHINLNATYGHSMLYHALSQNPEFVRLFGDRVFKHLFHEGVITAGHIEPRFLDMREQLRRFIPNMDLYALNTWVPNRHDVFLEACRREGVFTFAGPTLRVDGMMTLGGAVPAGARLSMTSETSGGRLVYTLDESDPALDVPLDAFDFQSLFTAGAEKRVLLPTAPAARGWSERIDYPDSRWRRVSGLPGGVGYDQRGFYASAISLDVEADMLNRTASCLVRIPFSVTTDPQSFQLLLLRMRYDDGFVAYLNGAEIARRRVEGFPQWNSLAEEGSRSRSRSGLETIDVSAYLSSLDRGDNLLAIHALNASLDSSDFLINATLEAGTLRSDGPEHPVQIYTGPITLTQSVHIKARIKLQDQWSALTESFFSVGPILASLRISELMYHPPDAKAEFIELMNVGTYPIDLNRVHFTDGIRFTFGTLELQPGERTLVVKDRVAFESQYGSDAPIAGEYEGSLNNGGETIELNDPAGQTIQIFSYSDAWYPETDGDGFSLVVVEPRRVDGNLSDRTSWRPSRELMGSPGWRN